MNEPHPQHSRQGQAAMARILRRFEEQWQHGDSQPEHASPAEFWTNLSAEEQDTLSESEKATVIGALTQVAERLRSSDTAAGQAGPADSTVRRSSEKTVTEVGRDTIAIHGDEAGLAAPHIDRTASGMSGPAVESDGPALSPAAAEQAPSEWTDSSNQTIDSSPAREGGLPTSGPIDETVVSVPQTPERSGPSDVTPPATGVDAPETTPAALEETINAELRRPSDYEATVEMQSEASGTSPSQHDPKAYAFSWTPDNEQITPAQTVKGAPSVAGYEILSELGRGGMGVVYKARHRGLKREVALKMILAGSHAGPALLERFRAEAEAVAHLQHANIVQIYDVGNQDGLPYFSLEYVDGASLDDEIDGKPQLEQLAADMVETLARAMHYAHQQGIVHRDLKPANVLLTKDRVPKITDFGLVKRLEGEDSGQTRTGTIMGTPSYMAPEQGRGEKNLGPPADVYALGAILYVMLTGRPPFLAATPVDTVMQLLKEEPVPPSRLQPQVSKDVETICLRCLQKEPDKRYADAEELAEDLRLFQNGEPIKARPVGRVERTWSWCRRNRLVASLLAIAAVLALTVLIGAPVATVVIALERNEAIDARDDAEANAVAARQAQQEAELARSDAEAAQQTAEQAQREAEENEQQAKEERDRADKNAEAADKQRELAIGAIDTLVTKVQNQLDDTARTFRLKRDLLNTAFEGLSKVTAGSELRTDEADGTMAKAHLKMGRIFEELGRADAARDEYASAHQIMTRLQKADADNPSVKYDLSRAAMRVADATLLIGDPDQAHQYSKQALDLRLELSKEYKQIDLYRNLARARVQFGDVRRDQGEVEEAKRQFVMARTLQEQLLPLVPESQRRAQETDLRITYDRLGGLHLIWLADPETAKEYYLKVLKIVRSWVEEDRQSFGNRRTLALTLENLGKVNLKLDDVGAAEKNYQESLSLLEKLAQEEDPELLLVQGRLALVLARAGRYQESAQQAEELRKISPEYDRNLYNVACCFALCVSAIGEDGDTDQRRSYIDSAIHVLRQWMAHVDKKGKYLELDPDLDAIRMQPEFQAILQELADKTTLDPESDETKSEQ